MNVHPDSGDLSFVVTNNQSSEGMIFLLDGGETILCFQREVYVTVCSHGSAT